MNPLVLKLGGKLLDSRDELAQLFTLLVAYRQENSRPIVIVHGGGYLVDELMRKLSLPVMRRNGLRVTPPDQIEVITGALAGTANKLLLAEAKRVQLPAVGLCLADGDMACVTPLSAELGHVGRAEPGCDRLLIGLLAQQFVPIISSIGITEQGELMNVNADWAATAVAALLSAELVLLSDVPGVLDTEGQLIPSITTESAQQLIDEGVIQGGMVVKVNAALEAATTLGRAITIASWQQPEQLLALFAGETIGTRIMHQS